MATRFSTSMERFVGLDVLRGLAALSVVFWHWQNFYFNGTDAPGTLDPALLPLHAIFGLAYDRGWLVVDLFFMLSGFIFYWLYESPIREGRIGGGRFALWRFSRLYPLHLATLLFVAALGSGIVFANRDIWHFALQLLFASSWGLEHGLSFNGPIWSVSVEVLVYAVFFICCRYASARPVWRLVLALFGLLLLKELYSPLGRGIGGFFLGGWLFDVYCRWQLGEAAQARARRMAWASALAWCVTLLLYSMPAVTAPHVVSSAWPTLLFGLSLLALALNEAHISKRLARWAWLGDISYSSYLLHFPLQMVCILAAQRWHLPAGMFSQPWFLLAFFAGLLALSWLCHLRLELPVQNALRRGYGV